MQETKSIQKSIRFSETTFQCVEDYAGANFNDKLEKLLKDYGEKGQLQKEISMLYKERDKLIEDINNLINIKNSFEELREHLVDEKNLFQRREIADRIKRSGHRPTESVVEHLQKLDQITGKECTLKEVLRGNRNGMFRDTYGEEAQNHAGEICRELKEQELQQKILQLRQPQI